MRLWRSYSRPVADQPVALLLALEQHRSATSSEHIPFLKRVQQVFPGDFWVNYRLGSVLDEINRTGETVGYFRAAVAARPSAVHARNNLGMVLLKTGHLEEAVEEFRQVNPDAAILRTAFGLCLESKGGYDEALARHHEGRTLPEAAGIAARLARLPDTPGAAERRAARVAGSERGQPARPGTCSSVPVNLDGWMAT